MKREPPCQGQDMDYHSVILFCGRHARDTCMKKSHNNFIFDIVLQFNPLV